MADTGSPDRTLIEMESISKRFGRVVALSDVDFELRENEIMGLLGDNGSGKSTLMKVLVGFHEADAGTIKIRGEPTELSSPQEAREYGISTVYQDLALVDTMSVATNMHLARYPKRKIGKVIPIVDWNRMNKEAFEILKNRMNIEIDPTQRVEYLSGGERQAIAIARSLVTDPDIIIMDEPTSALSPDSAERVQKLVEALKEQGISIILISHNLDEVFSLTDRITVLDNGRLVGVVDSDSVTKNDVVKMIVEGRPPGEATESTETEAA